MTPDELASLDRTAFVARFGHVFEHSPRVADLAFEDRPFADLAALHAAMCRVVDRASEAEKLALLRAHPELGAGTPLTRASNEEQGRLGLDRMAAGEAATMAGLNAAYRARFGFPFIIAVRGQKDRGMIEQAMRARLANPPEQETATALAQVAEIARFRLEALWAA